MGSGGAASTARRGGGQLTSTATAVGWGGDALQLRPADCPAATGVGRQVGRQCLGQAGRVNDGGRQGAGRGAGRGGACHIASASGWARQAGLKPAHTAGACRARQGQHTHRQTRGPPPPPSSALRRPYCLAACGSTTAAVSSSSLHAAARSASCCCVSRSRRATAAGSAEVRSQWRATHWRTRGWLALYTPPRGRAGEEGGRQAGQGGGAERVGRRGQRRGHTFWSARLDGTAAAAIWHIRKGSGRCGSSTQHRRAPALTAPRAAGPLQHQPLSECCGAMWTLATSPRSALLRQPGGDCRHGLPAGPDRLHMRGWPGCTHVCRALGAESGPNLHTGACTTPEHAAWGGRCSTGAGSRTRDGLGLRRLRRRRQSLSARLASHRLPLPPGYIRATRGKA